jgi:ketosteroid isomerase-like protein
MHDFPGWGVRPWDLGDLSLETRAPRLGTLRIPLKEYPVKIQIFHFAALVWLVLALGACQSTDHSVNQDPLKHQQGEGDAQAVQRLVDAWHAAAAAVDAEGYLEALSADAVFLGTDPEERWDKAGFTAYVRHYFVDLKRGWTYVPSRRQVMFSPDGRMAWFDERLENAGYGVLRGTGVLRLEEKGWRICHYSMTFAITNERTKAVVQLLRGSAEEPGVSGSQAPN